MRVVLDTNILFAALPSSSKYHAIWTALQSGEYEICVTTDILAEYEEKLQERFRAGVSSNVMAFLMHAPDVAFITNYYFWNLIVDDPDDNKFVDCAVSANADFIVTNDKHFRVLKNTPFPTIKVVTADEFLEILVDKAN